MAALAETLRAYQLERAVETIPVWQMISAQPEALRRSVDSWIKELGDGTAVKGQSTVGGGSLPGETLPSWLLRLEPERPTSFAAALRRADPPVIVRIEDDGVLLDPRTVLPWQEEPLLAALRGAQNDR